MADGDTPPVNAVGEAGTTSLRDFIPLLEHATDLLGLAPHNAQDLIERVRRFPAPGEPGRERFGAADKKPLSHVDRVEAIDALYELFTVPRARSLITDARRLLGHVLRDVALLQDLLTSLATGSASPGARWSWRSGCWGSVSRSSGPFPTAWVTMPLRRGRWR
jgi:hypothetical protein